MVQLPLSTPRPPRPRYAQPEPTPAPKRRGLVAATFHLLTSPSMAFLLLFPTVGYYTLVAFVSVLLPEGSLGGILIRAGSLVLLLIAYIVIPAKKRRRFSKFLLPATVFFLFYTYRLTENVLFLNIEIPPDTYFVFLSYFLSCLVPAYMLASMERGIHDDDMIRLLSVFSVLFVAGMALNREALSVSAENRAMLDKINPISLAYIASSLLLYYLLTFARSKRSVVEALLIVPVLLLIAAIARSRGMLISTGVTLLVYVLAVKGTRRIWTLLGLAAAAVVLGLYANPDYIERLIDALSRIDTDTDMSTATRVTSFTGAWNQFLDDPVLGRYAIELQTNYYPHNIYLESLMAVGIVGTLPFFLHIGLAARAAYGLLRQSEPSFTSMFIALLFIRDAVGAAASGGLWSAAGFWITSFLAIAMWYGRRQDIQLLHSRERRLQRARSYRQAEAHLGLTSR